MENFQDIILSQHGGIGHILINRPKSLNAINFDMVQCIADALRQWAGDSGIGAVMIEGAGERAFCAGGDVVAVSRAAKENSDLSRTFFQAEYRLNTAIHRYAKPYIAFIDGITMGGGVGLSVHGSHRIVTENTLFAMPETGIGLFPDVGGSHFLSRCPGETGIYLGLTGARLKAADMIALGLADHFMPSSARDAFIAALGAADLTCGDADRQINDIVDGFAESAGAPPLDEHRDAIDRIFAGSDMAAIMARLEREDTDFARTTLAHLETKSPTMLKVALAQLRRGARQDFDANMKMEYRLVRHALRPGADFHEGVRALLIDKDKSPKWVPARLAEVTEDIVADFFHPPPEGDLTL